MPEMREQHPVALYILEPSDTEYVAKDHKGRCPRYVIKQIDGDCWYFMNREKTEEFLEIHGLVPVSEAEMARLRQD